LRRITAAPNPPCKIGTKKRAVTRAFLSQFPSIWSKTKPA
jgi:hypothetical protein